MHNEAPIKSKQSAIPISLALQGGGAWGAFTWGVLDHLLSRNDIRIDQISGTSAGAINGAIVCSALAKRNPAAARADLETFWRGVAEPTSSTLLKTLMGPFGDVLTRGVNQWLSLGGSLSPYQLDPFDANPLRASIERYVDIDAIASGEGPQLFVTATNVRTGLPRVFGPSQISVDALAASACLPQLFRSVQIDGDAYWDGGYSANPAMWPLIRTGAAHDIVLVQLAPEHEAQVPQNVKAIGERAAQIMFNASLVTQMQAISAMASTVVGTDAPLARTRFHRIGPPVTNAVGNANPAGDRSWTWLAQLRDEGQQAAQSFMEKHKKQLGKTSSLDIARVYFDQRKTKVKLPSAELQFS
jgi:NTE family protein